MRMILTFKSRSGGILACAQFEAKRSDPVCVG
jgi:hypothetical protein